MVASDTTGYYGASVNLSILIVPGSIGFAELPGILPVILPVRQYDWLDSVGRYLIKYIRRFSKRVEISSRKIDF